VIQCIKPAHLAAPGHTHNMHTSAIMMPCSMCWPYHTSAIYGCKSQWHHHNGTQQAAHCSHPFHLSGSLISQMRMVWLTSSSK
jgi:hypothetical protein